MDNFLTPSERHLTDTFLHDDFSKDVEPDIHRHIGGFVMSKSGYWTLADLRTGKVLVAHA